MSCNVAGLLRYPDNKLAKIFTDDGKRVTGKSVRAWLLKQQEEGWRVIPLGECDDFDKEHGCRGHEILESEEQKEPAHGLRPG